MDTGQFGDVTAISSTCIWIQVTCGYRSICCNQVKRMMSQGSDHKVVTSTDYLLIKVTVEKLLVEKDYLSSLFELALFDDHLR